MSRRNDGSGWSMPVYPRRIDHTGQDDPSKPSEEAKASWDARHARAKAKRLEALSSEKFKIALATLLGKDAAQAYVLERQRKVAEEP